MRTTQGEIFRQRKGINEDKKKWWAVAESNCGHEAFQASALPTELTAHHEKLVLKHKLLASLKSRISAD